MLADNDAFTNVSRKMRMFHGKTNIASPNKKKE